MKTIFVYPNMTLPPIPSNLETLGDKFAIEKIFEFIIGYREWLIKQVKSIDDIKKMFDIIYNCLRATLNQKYHQWHDFLNEIREEIEKQHLQKRIK